ncbi:MAG: hypothetical protein MUE50_09530 [Pirellulaceae bacterium]|jgi:hypothetical protein|nr:hypothetical protein [Pirellulaceae bacterium]
MPTQYLVLTDVDAIQRYVFSSVRMAAIVGASQIVRRFDGELEGLATGDFQATRAVVNGGNGLFVFPAELPAVGFGTEAVRAFRETSVNGSLTASSPFAFDDGGFPAALQLALADLDRRKREGTVQDEPLGLGLAQTCQYCGCEPGQPARRIVGGESRVVGTACARKLDARNLQRTQSSGDLLARDFNELADDDYLATIVIDGDGLGERLKILQSPDEYAAFSENVKRVQGSALDAGFARLRSRQGGADGNLTPDRFELLYHGGDDLVLACQGRWAFPFVEAFSAKLEQEKWGWADPAGRIGFSAGVTIARSGFPFRMAHAIAGELLRNAKRHAKDNHWPEGGVDFAIVSEASGDAATILAEREIRLQGRTELSLTGRPYRLNTRETHSLSRLREACAALKNKNFPPNRLFDLRNAVTGSAWSDTGVEARVRLSTITADLQQYLHQWESRVERVPDLKAAWAAARSKLPIDDRTYAHSDLADAMYLWETCLGNQD